MLCVDTEATPRLVDRAGLLAALDRAAARRVTIISAPAGSGKTSLLRAWADRPGQRRRLAVVQVGRDQQDAQDFWLSLLEAVRQASGPASGENPPMATPDFNGQAMVDRVLAELDRARDITLVVDDLHELSSPETLSQFARLLTHLPTGAHALVTTRHDLRLRLHRLRLAGELAEIRAAELRFSELETRDLLTASGIALSEAGTALLHQRTEGWAAGLRLAVLSLASHPDPERFVREFSGTNHAVAEYLLAEMLERQPDDIQDLLLSTCLPERVNGELADLLTGHPGSERILLDLEDTNAFVASLDPERTWFRYHHLFADLLRLELRRRRLPDHVRALHRRAAAWFGEHGQVVDAIRHAQAAGDWPDAARLLADHSFSLMLDGHAQTMRSLVRAFPLGADHPELALVCAGSDLAQGNLDEAAAYLAIADAYAETTPPDGQRRLRVAIASLKLSLARRRGHLASVVEQVRFLASPITGRSDEDIALGSDLRAVALMNLGSAEAALALPDAERHLQQGAHLARKIGRAYIEVGCLAQLGFASKIHSFTTTVLRCREAIALAERYGWETEPVIAPALVTLAGTLAWLGQFEEAEHWLQLSTQALQTDTGPDIRLLLHHATGILRACRGRHHEALKEFTEADRLGSRLTDTHALASLVTGWMLAAQARAGMLSEASAALEALADERAKSGEILNARAVICLADGDPAGALGAVRAVLDGTAPVIGFVTAVEAQLLAGLAHRALGDQRAADLAVERALALAEPDGLVLPFAMTGSRGLLAELPRQQTAHAELLTRILGVLDDAPPAAKAPRVRPLPGGLSEGELRVLRFLPTNLSRPEIAAELSVSVNTVSSHISSIYAKLQVGDRSAAVQRARELSLLAAR